MKRDLLAVGPTTPNAGPFALPHGVDLSTLAGIEAELDRTYGVLATSHSDPAIGPRLRILLGKHREVARRESVCADHITKAEHEEECGATQ